MSRLVKVKDDTYQALSKLKGEMQKTARHKVTFDEVITALLAVGGRTLPKETKQLGKKQP